MALYQTPGDRVEAAEHMLAYYGYYSLGVKVTAGGGFTTRLIELWESADTGNRAALARAFPAMGYAAETMQQPGGAERLAAFIRLEHDAHRKSKP